MWIPKSGVVSQQSRSHHYITDAPSRPIVKVRPEQNTPFLYHSTATMPYLTKEELEAIFANQPLANGGPFWTRVAEDVDWTIMGSGPGTGHFTNLTELRANTIEKLMKALQDPLELKIVHVFFGGENYEWTTMELEARGIRKSGEVFVSST